MMMKILVNGSMQDERDAVISVYDHGFLYGLGLFETFRTYDGRPFLLEEHLTRLHEGCQVLGIPWQADLQQVREDVERLLRANGLKDAYVRYSVSAGDHGLGLAGRLEAEPSIIVYMKPLSPVKSWYASGRPLQLLQTVRPTPETDRRLKSFQYMNGWLAKRELMSYPWAERAEGVQVNERGELTEGIVSNLFFVREGVIHTPSLDTGVLPGVTRAFVLGLAREAGLEAVEGSYQAKELLAAEEIFVTNSILEIVPVNQVYLSDGTSVSLPTPVPGSITRRLMELYGAYTHVA